MMRMARAQRNSVWRVLHRVTGLTRIPGASGDVDAADEAPKLPVTGAQENWQVLKGTTEMVAGQGAKPGVPGRVRIAKAAASFVSEAHFNAPPFSGLSAAERKTLTDRAERYSQALLADHDSGRT